LQESKVQSVNNNNNNNNILERQISQLFAEVISVWRESDIKKNEAVRRLAARMEEYFLQLGQPQEVETICRRITERLQAEGLEKTAHHVKDYLDDQYKRPYEKANSGQISQKFVLDDVLRKEPMVERTKDEVQWFAEFCKQLETQRQINEQAAKVRHIALLGSDSYSGDKKEWPPVHTHIPNREYKGAVYQELANFTEDLYKYYYDMYETLKDVEKWYITEKIPEGPFVRAVQQIRGYIADARKIIAPAKDLKYGTSMHNWFHTLIKFLDHGKHAGAVMTSIPSSQHFYTKKDGTQAADKRPFTREQVGDRTPYVEDLLESFAESKAFLNHVKAFFRSNKEYDRDKRILRWRREFVTKLVRTYADDEDFYNHISTFREKAMDEEVAARRINAKPKLSELA
jgi:hypothetical protein